MIEVTRVSKKSKFAPDIIGCKSSHILHAATSQQNKINLVISQNTSVR